MADIKSIAVVETPPTAQPTTLKSDHYERRSLAGDAWRRFRKNRLAMIGLGWGIFILFLAIFADLIAPYPYWEANLSAVRILPGANPDYALGTDLIGRDFLSRLIHGARTSLAIGIIVPIIGLLIGVPFGSIAGYRGGWTDFILLRLIEIGTAIPPLLFALLLISVAGPGFGNLIFIMSILSWLGAARLMRGQFLAGRERDYVLAARALGANERNIIFEHIFPNVIAPLVIGTALAIPATMFAEAGLSFLGLGITEPTPSWGKMAGATTGNMILVYWHLAIFPTLLIGLTMLCFAFVGDGLQDALDITYDK